MKNLLILGVLCAVGCAAAKAAPAPGESASSIALTYAVMQSDVAPAPAPLPETKCDGTGWITHGDGHRTPCPGCSACKKAQPLITPAVYLRKQEASPPPEVYTCDCEFHRGSCNCDVIPPGTPVPRKPKTISLTPTECSDGSCAAPTKRVTSSGSCASGSCGSSSAQSGGPVRRVFKGIRERRPVRRLFGRLFGR